MTLQEKAIKQLERISSHLAAIGEQEDYTDIAIQVLEQPSEDCISREMAIDVVRKWFDKIKLNGDICLDGIVSLPSATPQRPKGKWLDKKTTIKGAHGLAYGRYSCSVCKRKQPSKTNFCPNCGAKMVVVEW